MPLLPRYTEDRGSKQRNDLEPHAVLSHEGAIYESYAEIFAPYFAELVGTFILTMTFLCNYSPSSDPVWAATSNGFMVAALVYAFGHISGGNLNPSVSISLIFAGRHTPRVAAKLCVAQTLGAILAAVLRMQISAQTSVDIGPFEDRSWAQVGLVEVLYTAMISFVYLNCAASPRNNPVGNQNGFTGLAVGFCFIASGYAARDISHTVTNPAIAIGLTIVDAANSGMSTRGMKYLLFDILGAFVGAGMYRIVRPHEAGNPVSYLEPEQTIKDPVSAQIAAEFIGTFFLVFTKALNRLGQSANLGPEAWSMAAVLSAMVYSLRGVSGAYFNPAVLLASWTSGCCFLPGRVAAFCVLTQIMAGLVAVSLYAAVAHEGVRVRVNEEETAGAVAFGECAFTFLMCYVVLATGASSTAGPKGRPNNIAGLTYGACQTVGGFAIGNISGSMLNPAVVLAFGGLNLLSLETDTWCFHYIAYQVLAALLASAAFTATHSYAEINAARMKDEDNSLPRPAA
mmetsp:Transcript_8739/g.23393  ORF Transcript_8739/g.23393 Transcript_8739/m.23393 type:complete len:512 (+) Transcript_8739:119-1654(+)